MSPPLLPTAAWARETRTTVRTTEVTSNGRFQRPKCQKLPGTHPRLIHNWSRSGNERCTRTNGSHRTDHSGRRHSNLGRSPRRRDLPIRSTHNCQIQRKRIFLSQGQPPEWGGGVMLSISLSRPYSLTTRRAGTPPDDLSNVSRSEYHWKIFNEKTASYWLPVRLMSQ